MANWAFFDKRLKEPLLRDRLKAFKSLGLAVFAGVAAPLIETVLIDPLKLWMYPRPDVFGASGFPSWVPFCYAFYHPFLFSLARYSVGFAFFFLFLPPLASQVPLASSHKLMNVPLCFFAPL